MMIDHVLEPVFEAWLEVELLSGRLGLPFDKFFKFNAPEFRGRRWAWVDPKKDMEAAVLAMRNRIRPLRDIIADAGDDIYDVLAKVKEDEELAASYGLKLDPDQIDNSEIVDEPEEG
jgi:capsid protein